MEDFWFRRANGAEERFRGNLRIVGEDLRPEGMNAACGKRVRLDGLDGWRTAHQVLWSIRLLRGLIPPTPARGKKRDGRHFQDAHDPTSTKGEAHNVRTDSCPVEF